MPDPQVTKHNELPEFQFKGSIRKPSGSHMIYPVILFLVGIGIGVLPFLTTPITISSEGYLRYVPAWSISKSTPSAEQLKLDSLLIIEALISPADISHLRRDMPVNFTVHNFHPSQWGTLRGSILDLRDDVEVIEDKPYFKVRCMVDRNYLLSETGYRGNLKQDMTGRASFTVPQRSLWQLLSDDKFDN